MKWWNREQVKNLICFNIFQTIHEAHQEKEQWIGERCSFLFFAP